MCEYVTICFCIYVIYILYSVIIKKLVCTFVCLCLWTVVCTCVSVHKTNSTLISVQGWTSGSRNVLFGAKEDSAQRFELEKFIGNFLACVMLWVSNHVSISGHLINTHSRLCFPIYLLFQVKQEGSRYIVKISDFGMRLLLCVVCVCMHACTCICV